MGYNGRRVLDDARNAEREEGRRTTGRGDVIGI